MINIYLIRHGRASSGWDTTDPNLDLTGKGQSEKIALKSENVTYPSPSISKGFLFCPWSILNAVLIIKIYGSQPILA